MWAASTRPIPNDADDSRNTIHLNRRALCPPVMVLRPVGDGDRPDPFRVHQRWWRLDAGHVFARIGQRRECCKEHFIRAEGRRQDPLQDKALHQDVDHADELLGRHR